MDVTESEVVIVGAGPIGIELAVALKKAGVNYAHFDAKQIGYTISWFAPMTRFFSSNERIAIAGAPLLTADQSKASREEYLAYLRSVVMQFDLQINTYEPVVEIERGGIGRGGEGFILTTNPASGKRVHRCRKLVLATGGTDRPRRLNVEGENLPHVSAYFGDPHQYFGKRLLIIGGKNSAVEAALRCHHAGAHVSISYRREQLPAKHIKYWLMPEMNGLIASGRIPAYFQTTAKRITTTHVTLADASGKMIDVPADFVLSLIGYEQDNALFKFAGLQLSDDDGAPVFDENTMETSVSGVYVAGTAVGGTQEKYSVFIENCHVHVDRIVAALTGKRASGVSIAPEAIEMPES